MIDVKGGKTTQRSTDGADPYRLKNDPASSPLPYVLGGFLATVVIYVRSMFSEASAAPRDPDAADGARNAPAAPPDDLVLAPEAVADSADPAMTEPEALPVQAPALKFAASNVVSLFGSPPREKQAPVTSVDVAFTSEDPYDDWQQLNHEAEAMSSPEGGDGPSDTPEPDQPSQDDRGRDPNRAPIKSRSVYLTDIVSGGILVIAAADLLAHSSDPDGDALAIKDLSVSGGTIESVDGGFVFRPELGNTGQVQISYTITDGLADLPQTAHFAVLPRQLEATRGDDALTGTPHADGIDAGGGDDNILGNGGHDIISGGAGDDHIVAGDGDDVIFGGDGDDVIFGMGGADLISGGDGDDALYGGDGDDAVYGDAGADTLDGGNGDDLVDGGEGDDRIVGAADQDDDAYFGGAGQDTLDYSATEDGITVDLDAGTATGAEIGTDHVESFEVVIAGDGDDLFLIHDDSDTITYTGNDGDDVYEFSFDNSPSAEEQPTRVQITDFEHGDIIRSNRYDVYRDDDEEDDDDFESVFEAKTAPVDGFANVEYWHEWREEDDYTVVRIEEDDYDAIYEAYLKGHFDITYTAHT